MPTRKASRRQSKLSAQAGTSAEAEGPAPRRHRGDIMSPEKRSAVMARIKGRNTKPELAVAERLLAVGIPFETHARDLPGRPDFVFRDAMLVVLVDGDFWHGWRFPLWRDKLSPAWEAKIDANRRRDTRNMRKLRHRGWQLIRIWEHQIERNIDACIERVLSALVIARNSSP